MTSNSSLGGTSITLQFELSRDIDAAAQDVQAAINAAGGQLPNNLPSPPFMRKVNPADSSVLVIAMTSDTIPLNIVSDYADNIVGQQLARMKGVGQVNFGGARKPAIRIQIDPRKAAALGLQLDQIRATLATATVNAPKGQLIGSQQTLTVVHRRSGAGCEDLERGHRRLSQRRADPRERSGRRHPERGEHARRCVERGRRRAAATRRSRSGPAIHVLVQKQPGANVIETVDAIKAALPQLRAAVPQGIDMNIIADRTLTIRASVREVKLTLMITVVLVVFVIFLFLRNVMATAIPSAVIPVSLLATAAVMLPAHFTLDNLSLMALTIAVGFVVDDAIVMVEAIWRRIEHGEKPFQAALAGSREIGFTILTISISLIAVFTPGDVHGWRHRHHHARVRAHPERGGARVGDAVTDAHSMLCARFLKPPRPLTSAIHEGPWRRAFIGLETSYARGLDVVLRHKFATLMVFVFTIVLTVRAVRHVADRLLSRSRTRASCRDR